MICIHDVVSSPLYEMTISPWHKTCGVIKKKKTRTVNAVTKTVMALFLRPVASELHGAEPSRVLHKDAPYISMCECATHAQNWFQIAARELTLFHSNAFECPTAWRADASASPAAVEKKNSTN